jgi:hypothetical protein
VPPRLRPTMKIGESKEEIVFFEWVVSDCRPDNKKIPQLHPRLALTQACRNEARLQHLVPLYCCDLKAP